MGLHRQRLPAFECADAAPDIVLLHGWGMSSAVWATWLGLLRRRANIVMFDLPGYNGSELASAYEVDALVNAILQQAPERAVYLGYSLGGMLATRIAATFPHRVDALVTLGSNAKFVASDDWPDAMPADTFSAFFQSTAKPALALKRFAGLQVHGCEQEKTWLKWLRGVQEDVAASCLQNGLECLNELDLRASLDELTVPALFMFAENDALVPVRAARHFPEDRVAIIAGAAHAMFLSHPQDCAQLLWQFLSQQQLLGEVTAEPGARNKRDVARSFSRAAATYDAVAELQRQVGDKLLQTLPTVKPQDDALVVDLGCGTGHFFAALSEHYPQARVVGVDIAEGMVQHAANRHPEGHWLCGDAENLPLPDDSVALIFTSLTIQWCENTLALFAEACRVLRPGGCMVFSTLGPDTLHELRQSWQQVDDCVHVNRFADWESLQQSLQRAGFTEPAHPREETVTLQYESLRDLTQELKSLGAHNVNAGRPPGLTGKTRLKQFIQAYENHRSEAGLLPATYQVWYGALHKPGAVN